MIEFANVSKRFTIQPRPGRRAAVVEALRSVSFELPAGSATGVIGPNGAGKSTLIGLLLGFLKPSGGSVEIAGQHARDYLRKHGASYLPERFALPGEWPVRNALEALARLEGLGAEAKQRVDHVIELTGLGDYTARRVHTLSRGLLQRLGIAQALLARRDLVVLDEPTEGLDPVWRIRLRELITELRGEGRTLLIASHDLHEVERAVDRALLLDNGELREIMDIHTPERARAYRIQLTSDFPLVSEIFADVVRLEPAVYVVRAATPADLSLRIGALIESGAAIVAVHPADDLESRFREAVGRSSR